MLSTRRKVILNMKQRQNLIIKIILMISGLTFLLLVASDAITSSAFSLNAMILAFARCVILAIGMMIILFKMPLTIQKLRDFFRLPYCVFGGLLSAATGLNFYSIWRDSKRLQVLADLLGVSGRMFVLICSILGVIVAAPIFICIIGWLLETYAKEKVNICLEMLDNRCAKWSEKKTFLCLLLIYLVASYQIIRANYNYNDDMGRVFSGYTGWGNHSRYISNFLSHIIHAGTYLFDISPVPQLLSIGIIIVASMIVVHQIMGRQTCSLWDVIAVLPLGLSPYFLACRSYKYDAPYMALSVLVSVIPLIFYRRHIAAYRVLVVVSVLAMCMTYQATLGIFPMLVVLLAFLMWCRGESMEEIKDLIVNSAIAYICGIIIFVLVIMVPNYRSMPNKEFSITSIFSNYRTYISFLLSDFKMEWLILVGILTICFIIKAVRKSSHNKFFSIILGGGVVCVMFLLSFGVYPFLEAPLYHPRAMFGVGVYIAFVGLGNLAQGKENWGTRILTAILSWMFITFSCAYGNALSAQKEYADFRISEVIQDLTELEEFNTNDEKIVQITGSVGYSPIIENMSDGYNMLKRLIPVQFDSSGWGEYKMLHYYGLDDVCISTYDNAITRVEIYDDWDVLHENFYHAIYEKDGYFIIELK